MHELKLSCLRDYLQRYQSTIPDLAGLAQTFESLVSQVDATILDTVIQF